MNSLAPIVLFVYNRPEHTRRTIEALQNNQLASESELIIFCDGPKSEQDIKQVTAVRDYLETISGFKRVTLHKQEKNRGLANSVITGVTKVVNQYGKIIVLEDDIVTSPYFLCYMNDALDIYRDEEQVISAHGYFYPVVGKLPETFFLKGADCWGWGTWQRGWAHFNPDGAQLLRQFESKQQIKEFNFNNSFPFYKMLKDQVAGKIDSWAIRWYASAFLSNKYTLYPSKTLVQNIGFDSSATHCQTRDVYNADLSRQKVEIDKREVKTNQLAYDLTADFLIKHRPSLQSRLVNWIKKYGIL